jgi:signal transduction histidine kinase
VAAIRNLEVDLLLHARSQDLEQRAAHEERVLATLDQGWEHVTSAAEEEAYVRAGEAIRAYLAAARRVRPDDAVTSAAMAPAFHSLEALLAINVRQADAAAARAARADRAGDLAGVGWLAAVGGLLALLLWWLWRRSLSPVLELSEVMGRFGAGDRAARAHIAGATELRSMGEAFNAMADELARQREAQMTFLAGIAHDLRNPLGPLKAAAAVLASDEHRITRNDTTIVRVLQRQVAHLDRLIGDLLDLGRIEAGKLELRLEQVDARTLAQEAVELHRPAATNVAFHLWMPPAPLPVRCDATRVHQVLNNLIGNAVKYSGGGGHVAVSVELAGDQVAFSVRDRGPGIAECDLERMFEPFERACEHETTPVPGHGLGLFLARRIVEAHEGTLRVRSTEGEGSTFRFELPLAQQPFPGETANADGAAVVVM